MNINHPEAGGFFIYTEGAIFSVYKVSFKKG
jgi:hypothetical protein